MVNKSFRFLLLALIPAACQQAEPVKNQPAAVEKSSGKPIVWGFTEQMDMPEGAMQLDSAGRIVMQSGAETDYFIEPGLPPYEKNNAPLLFKMVDNTKPFTFSVKTTPVHQVKYDAGMVFLYVSDKEWLKFAFEADERLKHRLVTVKTKDYSDDNNHDAVEATSVYLKVSSDTKVIGFYYSENNVDWQLVRIFKNEYPASLKLGIGTQSPAGKGNASVFEAMQFTQESVKDFRMGI